MLPDAASLASARYPENERTIAGFFVSTPSQTEDALRFSHLFQTLPVTELTPFERANEALYSLKQGQVRFRIVLTMNQDN